MSFPLVFKALGNWILHYTKCIYSKHLHAFSMYLFCVENLNRLLSLTERDTSWHLFGDRFKGTILQIYSSHGRRRPHKPHQHSDVSGTQSSCAVALSLTSMERGLDRVPGFRRLPVIENTSRIMSPRCLWCVKNNALLRWACRQRKASHNRALHLKNVSIVCSEKKNTRANVLNFDLDLTHLWIIESFFPSKDAIWFRRQEKFSCDVHDFRFHFLFK